MSKFTTEVRFICENAAGLTESKGFNDVNNIIQTAAPAVFDFDFPMFDEAYRLPLEIKILRHYYTREICEETVGLWKLRLQDRLNMIMPYYNKLYESELIEFNPLYDVDYTRDHTRENEGNETRTNSGREDVTDGGTRTRTETVDNDTTNTVETSTRNVVDTDTTNSNTNTGTMTGNNTTSVTDSNHETDARWDLYSDTPQGGIDVITNDSDGVIGNTYLTNARRITDTKDDSRTVNDTSNSQQNSTVTDSGNGTVDTTETGTLNTSETGTNDTSVSESENTSKTGNRITSGNGTTALTSTEDYVEHVRGKQGVLSYSKMLQEFRETFLNIDRMIINELSDLFFGLWA